MAAIGVARHVTGPCFASIQFDPTVSAPAFVNLGYSEDGFIITERPITVDVFSDRNGGTQGEPIDVQLMGKTATIRGRINDFDMATMSRLRQIATQSLLSPGQVPSAGCLLVNDGEHCRLLLQGVKDTAALTGGADEPDILTPMNFNVVIPRDAMDIQSGSRVLSIELTMTAYSFIDAADSNKRKLWNRDTVQ